MVEMDFSFPADYVGVASRFFMEYEPVYFASPPENSNKQTLKKPVERICRFCGLKYPATTFRKAAHLFPELLGNKTWFSDFECDQCNKLFSTYENELANLLGAERILTGTRTKKGRAIFKSPSQLAIHSQPRPEGENIIITKTIEENKSFSYDEDSGTLNITFKRNSYIPNLVYKAFLKIGLSVMEHSNASAYHLLYEYLTNRTKKNLKGCYLFTYYLLPDKCLPSHFIVFRKKAADNNFPTHIVGFFLMNYMVYLPLPLNGNDSCLSTGRMELPQPPPIFSSTSEQNIDRLVMDFSYSDFTSTDKVAGARQSIRMTVDKQEMSRLMRETDFRPERIISLDMFRDNNGMI